MFLGCESALTSLRGHKDPQVKTVGPRFASLFLQDLALSTMKKYSLSFSKSQFWASTVGFSSIPALINNCLVFFQTNIRNSKSTFQAVSAGICCQRSQENGVSILQRSSSC